MKNIRNFAGVTMVFDEITPVSVAHGQAERILKACANLDTSDQDFLVKLLEKAGALETAGEPAEVNLGPDPAIDAAIFPDAARLAGMGIADYSLKPKAGLQRQTAAERAEYDALFEHANRFN